MNLFLKGPLDSFIVGKDEQVIYFDRFSNSVSNHNLNKECVLLKSDIVRLS